MFGTRKPSANAYAQLGLETGVVAASPVKLTIMLYEGAISACIQAVNAMHQEEYARKGELLSKAILIIESGLRASLDKKVGGEIAQNLEALYMYMTETLMVANARMQVDKVTEIQSLLMELKSAWEAIEHKAVEASSQAALNQMVQQKAQMVQQRTQAAYGNAMLMGA
jgi:flagellar secretion chaperone FliS